MSRLDEEEQRRAFVSEGTAARARLAPRDGTMVQAVWFDAGPDRQGRLLLAVHHLAVDGVSWRILLPDLAEALAGRRRGRRTAAPARGHLAARLGAAAGRTGRHPARYHRTRPLGGRPRYTRPTGRTPGPRPGPRHLRDRRTPDP